MSSFKKIAFAVAAAVAMGTLVAAPANAATVALSGGNYAAGGNNGTTTALAVAIPVPADNKVETADVLTVAVTNAVAGSTISAVSENAKIVTSLDTTVAGGTNSVNASAGSNSVSIATGTGTSATFYVFTTSIETGKVTVSADGNTTVYYVKGTAGSAYNLSVTSPEYSGVSAATNVTATVTDVFGNSVETATITTTVLRGTVTTAFTWNATTKRYEAVITTPTTAGDVASLSRFNATAVTGLAIPKNEVAYIIKATDLNAQLDLLKAEIATEKAKSTKTAEDLAKALVDLGAANKALQDEKAAHAKAKADAEKAVADAKAAATKAIADAAAEKVSADKTIAELKKSFNALAKKWNAKNPKAKVASIK